MASYVLFVMRFRVSVLFNCYPQLSDDIWMNIYVCEIEFFLNLVLNNFVAETGLRSDLCLLLFELNHFN